MSPVTATLHALAAASTIGHNAVVPQQNTVSLAIILPNGIAPINMAQVADPAAEAEKCNLRDYLKCKDNGVKGCDLGLKQSDDCKLADLIDIMFPNLPPWVNVTAPISVVDYDNVTTITVDQTGPEANEAREASAPAQALERRQSSACPKHCKAWAALPPFGFWFGVCVADCKIRCKRGLSCP